MSNTNVLSLGAGVQSTVLYLWSMDSPSRLDIDAAVFADTGDETAPTYAHLKWMESLGGPPILRGSRGVHLSAALVNGVNSDGQHFVSIPAHLIEVEKADTLFGAETVRKRRGMQRRQCTSEFKIRVIQQTIRRRVLGLSPGRSVPKDATVTQVVGFSTDEAARATRMEGAPRQKNWMVRFPLIENGWSRDDCNAYLKKRVPHDVERSACVFCPYRSNDEWLRLQETDPKGFARAVKVDECLRGDAIVKRNMNAEMYIHSDRIPLDVVDFSRKRSSRFHEDCVGGCGL